ncbi:hypothetical protein CYMTET_53366 [Cymbomonas tetramitiformis]|uniref:Uncharacterized protein n=1 Tax=Cymbomonas tetramitiformis TaxID=36881 RepID=A0AAE0BIF0_9CHLO|nr:hypothetical protein CYMTET_53366 [Cymbomonas tetramitiformis]
MKLLKDLEHVDLSPWAISGLLFFLSPVALAWFLVWHRKRGVSITKEGAITSAPPKNRSLRDLHTEMVGNKGVYGLVYGSKPIHQFTSMHAGDDMP